MVHRHRHELTDPGRTASDNRRFVDAVVYVLKTGIPWADVPGRFNYLYHDGPS